MNPPEAEADKPSPHLPAGPKKDYSLKDGQTFSISIPGKSKDTQSTGVSDLFGSGPSNSGGGGGGGGGGPNKPFCGCLLNKQVPYCDRSESRESDWDRRRSQRSTLVVHAHTESLLCFPDVRTVMTL